MNRSAFFCAASSFVASFSASLCAALSICTVVACDPPEHTVELGQACEADVDCVAGTLCITTQKLDPASSEIDACIDGDKFCTVTCAVDEDCQDVGDGLICASEGPACDGACFVGSSS